MFWVSEYLGNLQYFFKVLLLIVWTTQRKKTNYEPLRTSNLTLIQELQVRA